MYPLDRGWTHQPLACLCRMRMEVLLPISLALRERTLSRHVASTLPAAAGGGGGPPVGVRDVMRWLTEGPLTASRGHAVDATAALTVALTFTHPAEGQETAWLQLRARECHQCMGSFKRFVAVRDRVSATFSPHQSHPWHPTPFRTRLSPAITAVASVWRRRQIESVYIDVLCKGGC